MAGSRARRTLEHWTRDLGTWEAWLFRKRQGGWVPEYPWDPPEVTVNGRHVWAVALIDVESFARGLAYRKPVASVTEPRPVEYLTIADVVAELNVNVSQVRTLIRIGSLPATASAGSHPANTRSTRPGRWSSPSPPT